MKLKFNKDGLSSEQLEAVEKLEKQVSIDENSAKSVISGVVAEAIKEAGINKEQLDAAYKALDNDNPESVHAAIKGITERFNEFVSQGQAKATERKSFNDNLMDLVENNMDAIKAASKISGKTEIGAMKAVGDMTIANNFPGSTAWTTDVRNNLIEIPQNRVWLRDIILNGTTDGRTITFPKENGGEGQVEPWTNPANDKAQLDFDLTSVTNFVKWIAGYVIIDREMLDDYSFMNSWIRAKMLLSLKKAENAFILNGTGDTNPVDGLLDVATAYAATPGLADNPVNRILDAAWGQIVTNTEDDYNPTHAILHPRDAVRIGLNQASGSGEYDLPQGSVGFANGRLNIGGLDVARTTIMDQNDFLVLDRNAAMFITKMAPELSVFVDATLAKKNKIMLRIEERATLAIFNDDAIVTGTLNTPTT